MRSTWWIGAAELDEDQRKIIELPLNGSYFISGPPGSGKTNLLLLRATYLNKNHLPNFVILVFTKTLNRFFRSGKTHYDFHPDRIWTHIALLIKIIKEHGDKNPDYSSITDFTTLRKQLISDINDVIHEKNLCNLFEVILLDEGQDFWPEEIEIFRILGKRIFAVADSRQKIYSGKDSIEILKKSVDSSFQLHFHYRNGLNICKLADNIANISTTYEPLASTSYYKESENPSYVELEKVNSFAEQADKVISKLEIQLTAYPEEFIGIIFPRREELNKFKPYIIRSKFASKAVISSDADFEFDDEKPIIITTFHGAKGLEFRALHICSCECIKKFPVQRNMSYTAVTRAKTALNIYHEKELSDFFEHAYFQLQKPANKITIKIDDLFK